MTALDKYVRLECGALWRPQTDAQRREVTLSFGDATLVISDGAGRPLAHWSLPALIRLNADEMPARYAPDDDVSEELEISDDMMVAALEEVRAALAKSRPQPGKLRQILTLGLIVTTLLLAVFWLPGALMRQTLAVVPGPKRVEIGQAMLAHLSPITGAPCRSQAAGDAANALAQRLFGGDTASRLLVVPQLDQGAVALPGGVIVLDSRTLRAANDPAVAAGFALASIAALPPEGALGSVLDQAGLGTTFRLLTTGEIPDAVLGDAARAVGDHVVDPARLRDLMSAAQIPQGPYLSAIDAQTGTMPDLGPDPLAGRALPLVLTDDHWVTLQNVCNG